MRSLTEDGEEIDGYWRSFHILPAPMFTSKYFDFWAIKKLSFLRAKELIEYHSNKLYDEVCVEVFV